jgi:DNA helicase-2/ATP-dependent DNA helicase PcrA
LVRVGIPYRVVGGTKFFDRREVKDLLAYLRVLVNPSDEVSLKRVVNVPKRGVGDTSVGRLDAWAQSQGRPYFEAMAMAAEAGITGKALKGINDFLAVIQTLREVEGGAAEVIEAVLERTGYIAELEAEGGIEAAGRIENLNELLGQAREFETLAEFLETVSLTANVEEAAPDGTQVTLMTLHTAKGLEFPVVFLIGLEDGVFPHVRSLGEPTELEEERRLAYVGITRARERLYLTHAWCRSLFGSTQYNPLSRFVAEIPKRGGQASGYGRSWADRDDRGRRSNDFDEPAGRVFGGSAHREDVVDAALRSAVATPAKTTGAEAIGLVVGDDIVHGRYGEGVILELLGSGDKTEAVVRFPGVGEKRFLLAWTPLKKAR